MIFAILKTAEGMRYKVEKLFSFVSIKDRYVPYYELSFVGLWKLGNIRPTEVYFYSGTKLLHHGTIDKFEFFKHDGKEKISVYSRSFTAQLCLSQPMPQVLYNVTLDDIFGLLETFPNVTYTQNTIGAKYMCFKENGSIWDAICAYGIKAYNFYPYIAPQAKVCVTRPESVNTIVPSGSIIKLAHGGGDRGVLTDIYMLDLEEEYTYNVSLDINTFKRTKYIPLDKQWLTDPNVGLNYKINYYSKARNYYKILYTGYSKENLLDKINIYGKLREISRVKFFGTSKGVFTELTCYQDNFCENSEQV